MNIDLHNHTKRCNHAIGECSEYIEAAINNKIDIFGFACHAPMKFDEKYRMNLCEVESYISEIAILREKYHNMIDIKIGFEVDYIKGKEHLIESKIINSNVDFLVGSVHFLNDWGFDNPEFLSEYNKIDIDEVWIAYLESIESMAQCGLFDIVGHFDLLKIFNNKPKLHLNKYIHNALDSIKDNNMALEINTAGLRKPIKEIYPSEEILTMAYKKSIPITFSSDAHTPDQVGYKKSEAVVLAKKVGFKEVISFSNRNREVYLL